MKKKITSILSLFCFPILDGPYDCWNAAQFMYKHILEKACKGRLKISSRQKVANILGIRFRNKKLE